MSGPNFPCIRVALDDILVSSSMQLRRRQDRAGVRSYKQSYMNGANMPPLKVARLNGGLVLIDGHHRYSALRELGQDTAEVYVVEARDENEARWLGAEGNLKNGLPLKAEEKRGVVLAYLKAGKYKKGTAGCLKSSREMAREIGCVSHATVLNAIRRHYPSVYLQMREPVEDWKAVRAKDEPCLEDCLQDDALAHLEKLRTSVRVLQGKDKESILKALEALMKEVIESIGAPAKSTQDLIEEYRIEENPEF